MQEKRCSKCGETKTAVEFVTRRRGLDSWCKACHREAARAKSAKQRENDKAALAPGGFNSQERETRILRRAFQDYKRFAERRGIRFTLANYTVFKLVTQNCNYCGQAAGWKDGYFSTLNGIDRVDNSRGYEPGNVVPCCFKCNRMKSTLGAGEFVEQAVKIAKKALGIA